DLLPRDGERAFEIAGEDQLRKLWRAGDVRALADHHETHLGRDIQRLEAGKTQRAHTHFANSESFLGAHPCTASAIALICGGVVPQQPPTMFNQPFSAHSRNCGASVSGVSGKPVSDSGSGKPAFG